MSSNGFSLIELLVVVAVFLILATVSTQIIAVTLTGSKKTGSLVKVRENVDFSFAVMERQIRNAKNVDCISSTSTQLDYTDENGVSTSFSCLGGANGYIASGAARLTSDLVYVDCTQIVFTCTPESSGVPPFVDIAVTAEGADVQGSEGAQVTTSTKILLRSF